MKRIFLLLVLLFLLLSACTSVGGTTEADNEIVDVTATTGVPPTQTESAPSTVTPLPSTEAPIETIMPLTPTDPPTPTEPQPTPVMPFTAESIGPGQQEAYIFPSSSGEEIVFWLYLPEEYDDGQTWPLIISLHGFIGFEPSIENVRGQSPPVWVDPEVDFPFIVISPMAPSGAWSLYFEPLDELNFLPGSARVRLLHGNGHCHSHSVLLALPQSLVVFLIMLTTQSRRISAI
jgi:hypothetical protein